MSCDVILPAHGPDARDKAPEHESKGWLTCAQRLSCAQHAMQPECRCLAERSVSGHQCPPARAWGRVRAWARYALCRTTASREATRRAEGYLVLLCRHKVGETT